MGRKRDERIERTRERLEEAADKLRDRADQLGRKKPSRGRGAFRLLPLAGLVAGVAALLRKGDVRQKGKGVVDKAGPLAGKARSAGQTLAGKAREGVSRLRGGG